MKLYNCEYQKIEAVIRSSMKKNLPGMYQILQSFIGQEADNMIILMMIRNPVKLINILKVLYDCDTARLIIRRVILEPVFSGYRSPPNLDLNRLVELLFTDPLLFGKTLYSYLC